MSLKTTNLLFNLFFILKSVSVLSAMLKLKQFLRAVKFELRPSKLHSFDGYPTEVLMNQYTSSKILLNFNLLQWGYWVNLLLDKSNRMSYLSVCLSVASRKGLYTYILEEGSFIFPGEINPRKNTSINI